MENQNLLEVFDREMQCEYKDRLYLARDNGSILRLPKPDSRLSKWDNVWTFGTKDERTGYMILTGNIRVHQVVATAFHGAPEDPNMVIDHIDTNRCNNRPENLRWVTRLENVLNNPITRRRIEMLCGSIENFLKDPSKLRESASEPNTKWMRTVSKEEAAKCLKNLSRWAEEDKALEQQRPKGNGGSLGEWIFDVPKDASDNSFGEPWDKDWHTREYKSDYQRQKEEIEEMNRRIYEKQYGLKESLTPGALQLNWKVPSEFPLCPIQHSPTPLQDYLANLKAGEVFCRNDVYESIVFKADISDDGNTLAVITTSEHVKGSSGYVLCTITNQDGYFIHENQHSYFEEIGAEKYFTLALGREWTGGDVFDDFC